MRETEATADARRAMEICNACRYCEGYCAVFPAMELRREFSAADLGYLANLCHGCQGCFYSCQYAPPHEFGINLPQSFAEVRAESYREHAWPRPLGEMFQRNGTVVSIATALCIAAVFLLVASLQQPDAAFGPHAGPGAFYAVIPLPTMLTVAGVVFVYGLLALLMSVARFWRDGGAGSPRLRPLLHALHDALTLRNLGGGGDGCNYPDEGFSHTRRWLHHAMFYGFLLCFVATSIAAVDHNLFGWPAPYALLSAPVAFGTVGGALMVVGTAGLIRMKIIADPAPAARALLGGEYALLTLLLLVAVTGLLLLALRATAAMGTVLAVHLGCVLALFLVLPYSKFVHAPFRLAALLRAAMERQ
jgi:citrate/tricarballylate utilization protein